MDKEEAATIVSKELNVLRGKAYSELVRLIGTEMVFEKRGSSGAAYQIEIEAFWDDPRKIDDNLRVTASIDDGRFLSALSPISVAFIMNPTGNFIGE